MLENLNSITSFSKTYQSSLTLKGGSTSHLGLLPSGKKRKPPYSVLKPLRYKVGGPSEVCARFFVRDEPHGHGVADGLLDGTALDMGLLMGCLRPHDICHQRSAPGFLCGMGPHGQGAADGLFETALDTELLLDCLRLHDICHQRSAPGGGQDCTGRAWHLARP